MRRRKRFQKTVVYIMLITLLLTTLLAGLSIFF
ncbi:stressosome-associated protein Prli42 [Peribacillus kribbensis]|nr:stressosome-associated protein Prli42 [Peribacillus kribbensis]